MYSETVVTRPAQPVLPGMPGGESGPAPTDAFMLGLSDVEVGPSERRIPVGRAARITGYHPIRPGHGLVPFDSGLERSFLDCLVTLPGVVKVVAQPVTVKFAVWGDRRKYTPDFDVVLSHVPKCLEALGLRQPRFFVEVKHTKLLDECAQRLEWALTALRMATGIPVLLFTEHEIRVRREEYFYV